MSSQNILQFSSMNNLKFSLNLLWYVNANRIAISSNKYLHVVLNIQTTFGIAKEKTVEISNKFPIFE